MAYIGTILIIIGIAGIGMGSMMFGDIGVACTIAGMAALFSGVGFVVLDRTIKELR